MNKRLRDAILLIIDTDPCAEELERICQLFAHDFAEGKSLMLFLYRELWNALKERDDDAAELIVILGIKLNIFREEKRFVNVLQELIAEDWHFAHEDIVSALEMIRGDETLTALETAAHSRPPYLARVDGAAALIRKAIWAIWKVQTIQALHLLKKLSHDEDPIISHFASKQLRRKMDFDK